MNDAIINLLLKPPSLLYIREIRRKMDQNQQYLQTAAPSVSARVREILSQNGVIWDQQIFEREWQGVVEEAVIRLRSVEK